MQDKAQWLEQMMAQWETSLLRLCFAYLHDASLAQDAVQETFLKAWMGYEHYRRDARESTWLTRIAVNVSKDMLKSAYARHTDLSTALETLPAGGAFSPADDTVTQAVMALPLKYREAVILRWLQGLSGEETARVLRIPRSTVYHRLNKAQQLLKEALEEWYHEAD
ncbi:MAG: sigma-70 family RNA polymerase sigma factor [Clostridiales bacterium]|nr:sigma-70 family RNA polymerase sigma factor [Clostridiales bacterium]